MKTRDSYPSDVSDEEWAFAAPYLSLMTQNAPQRVHSLREVFNALRWLARTGSPWRYLPNDLPPWYTVYQQTQRWVKARCFDTMVHDLRELLRIAQRREVQSADAPLSGHTDFFPEQEDRMGDPGRQENGRICAAVGTVGHSLPARVAPVDLQAREQEAGLPPSPQETVGNCENMAFARPGWYPGRAAVRAAQKLGIEVMALRLPQARKGFVLLPRRWTGERFFSGAVRFRRLARDYERLHDTAAGIC